MANVKRKVSWTEKALWEKNRIMEFWFEKTGSTSYPIKLEKLILKSTALLGRHPQIGAWFDKELNIRFKTIRSFRIYYTFDSKNIFIISVWDMRRNPKNFKL
jgi:plasmid stabilization system protein ParE